VQTPTKGSLPQFAGIRGQAFRTLREAVHHTATQNGPMKNIASDLDWSPSELCLRSTLGTDNARPFPLDDPTERAVTLQQMTGDYSILLTMAEKLGFELKLKADRYPEMLQHVATSLEHITKEFSQLRLMVPLADSVPTKGKR